MHLERYEFEVLGNRYDFYSEGPRGRIRKTIIYQMQKKGHSPLYNLTFGDWNEDLNRIDDKTMSNNGDRQKILVTVAASVIHFMEQNGEAHDRRVYT